MKLLIASFNPGKQAEFKRIIGQEFELVYPQDLGLKDEVEETGQTFAANSELKARHYFNLAQIPVLADDGGLEIDRLGGEPGVKSRRWLGRPATDEELIQETLTRLAKFPAKADRTAWLKTVITYFDGQQLLQETGAIKGYIAPQPSKNRTVGYPFRDLLIVEEFNKYYGELTDQEHQQVNHREKALRRLMLKLNHG